MVEVYVVLPARFSTDNFYAKLTGRWYIKEQDGSLCLEVKYKIGLFFSETKFFDSSFIREIQGEYTK